MRLRTDIRRDNFGAQAATTRAAAWYAKEKADSWYLAKGLPQKRWRQYVGIVITAFQAKSAAMPINITQSSGSLSRSGILFLRCGGVGCCGVCAVGWVQGLKRSTGAGTGTAGFQASKSCGFIQFCLVVVDKSLQNVDEPKNLS